MKKILLFLCLTSIHSISHGQLKYYTYDSINGNNINARAMLHGSLWEYSVYYNANSFTGCEFPAGSGKNVATFSGILLSAYENGNILHLSFGKYNTNYPDHRVDFWPGPLDNNGNTDTATIEKWAKIWKVTATDIDNFLAQTNHTVGNTPPAILHWPGKGNTYARGNNNAPLDVQEDMAPYYDFNSNGVYEPLLGEYPLIKGNQLLWWVLNDNASFHTATDNGQSLKVQVEVTAEAYSRGTLIDNVVYYSYRIKNKSGINYTNMRFGQYVDFDLGSAFNDYGGFDSTMRMGYTYNDSTDGNGTNGTYGASVPVAGLTFIDVPGDDANNLVPLGGFRYLNHQSNIQSEHFLDSSMRIMEPYFNGCVEDAPAGDNKFIISTSDFDLNNGFWTGITTALVVADPSPNNVCPFFDSTIIKIVADTAWGNQATALAINNMPSGLQAISLYPNPAKNTLVVTGDRIAAKTKLSIFDALGRKHIVQANIKAKEAVLDIAHLPTGVYILAIDGQYSERFLKQ